MKNKFIKPDDFVEAVTDKLENDGIKRGARLYVAGTRAFPISEEDPYTQRIKFFCHIILDTKAMVFDPRLFVLDPNSVKKLGNKEHKKLEERLRAMAEAMGEDEIEANLDTSTH